MSAEVPPLAPLIGLTGGIACGKSTVSRLLAARGAVIIDADVLAREVVAPHGPALADIVATFGAEVLGPDGALDRAALGARVFASPEARARLERITHPRIAALSLERLRDARTSGASLVVYDAALLFESGRAEAFRPVVVVTAPREVQRQRLMDRDGLDTAAADARIDSQMPVAAKAALADHVIDNGQSVAHTEAQVAALWQEWTRPCTPAPSTP
jgi:dephospho-CoA kinase